MKKRMRRKSRFYYALSEEKCDRFSIVVHRRRYFLHMVKYHGFIARVCSADSAVKVAQDVIEFMQSS